MKTPPEPRFQSKNAKNKFAKVLAKHGDKLGEMDVTMILAAAESYSDECVDEALDIVEAKLAALLGLEDPLVTKMLHIIYEERPWKRKG